MLESPVDQKGNADSEREQAQPNRPTSEEVAQKFRFHDVPP
jgi:hypothetical protein